MVLLQVAIPSGPLPGYLKAEVGDTTTGESEFSDQIRYSAEAGFMAGNGSESNYGFAA